MRLINSKSLRLEEFVDNMIPEYAILSHTWGEMEVTFKDMQGSNANEMKGFTKIKSCCAQAAGDGFDYVWVDTCCIDKSSSAELSEAINSMYKWYQNAMICYAYLEDITMTYSSGDVQYPPIQSSNWFTRGWTLQELIAPQFLEFYDKNWIGIGTKKSRKDEISKITGIELKVLEGAEPWTCNVAQRMSWAARRSTTRKEDTAYCLMGLFNVNMPLLYGEGGYKAFRRLQEEILKVTEDYTLFAWSSLSQLKFVHGLLADSPVLFGNMSAFQNEWRYEDLQIGSPAKFTSQISTKQQDLQDDPQDDPPYITSRGLRISLPVGAISENKYWACLFCPRKQNEQLLWPCVRLDRLNDDPHVYHRVNAFDLKFFTTDEVREFQYMTITVKFASSIVSQWVSSIGWAGFDRAAKDSFCKINLVPDPGLKLSIHNAYPSRPEDQELFSYKSLEFDEFRNECMIAFQDSDLRIFFILVGLPKDRLIASCKVLTHAEKDAEISSFKDLVSHLGRTDRDMKRLPSRNLVVAALKRISISNQTIEYSLNVHLRSGQRQDEFRS